MGETTVVLVEDHAVVREGLALLVDSADGMRVVGQAATMAEGLALISEVRPTVAIVDLLLPDGSGIELCGKLDTGADLRVLILSATGQIEQLHAALEAGATGYMLKVASGTAIAEAIRDVAAGQTVIDPSLASELFDLLRSPPSLPEPLDRLGQPELEVLSELADGRSTAEIAARLYMSKGTLNNRVSKILRTTGMRSRTEAALLAAEHRDAIARYLRASRA